MVAIASGKRALAASFVSAALAACAGAGAPSAEWLEKARAKVPAGSADYSSVLADAMAYKAGELDFDELEDRIVARKLPPHSLGDDYLEMRPPPPPPGMDFTPLVMPDDWKGNWGEVQMALVAGEISQEEYERLHAAAHPSCKRGD